MGFKRGNTTSTLFGRIDGLINLFIDEINNDEEIKRYLVFPTKQPMATKSVDYSNNVIYQYDIPEKINCPIKYSISKPTEVVKEYRECDQVLFPYPSEDSKITGVYPMMFVYNYVYSLAKTDKLIDSNIFKIDILLPLNYIEIFPYGESRLHKVMERLAYLFDRVELDEESKSIFGDLKFRLVNNCVEQKINKTNDIITTTLYIETKLVGTRTDSTNGVMKSGYL